MSDQISKYALTPGDWEVSKTDPRVVEAGDRIVCRCERPEDAQAIAILQRRAMELAAGEVDVDFRGVGKIAGKLTAIDG